MIELATVKTIFDILVPLFKMRREGDLNEKKRFYGSLVLPSFEMLVKIHKDYVTNFTKLRNIFLREEWPSRETIMWLREVGTEYVSERDRLKEFDSNIENFRNYFVRAGLSHSETDVIYSAFVEYASAVVTYIDSSLSKTSASWYTDFTEIMEIRAERFDGTFKLLKDRELISAKAQPGMCLKC